MTAGLRRALVLVVGMLVSAVFHPGRLAAQEPDLFNRTVISLAYTSDGPVDRGDIERLIEIHAGKPLTEDATGATIRNLFATRRFSDVQIEAAPAEGGVAVTIHLFRAFRVFPLRFSRGAHLTREELRRTVPFSEGSSFQPDLLFQGTAAIKRRLEEDGYLQAQINPEVSYDWKTFDVSVLYRIEAGTRARVARAFFDGETAPYTADDLLKKARMKPGDRYKESKARTDAARMTELLHKDSRLKGSVELIAAQRTDDGRVMPVYRIAVGPNVVFETVGIKAKTVRNDVRDLLEGENFDEDLVLQYVENKRRDLQRKGHYRAKVDYSIKETPQTYTVTITVDEGPHFEIEKIAFHGNASVKDKELFKLMVTRKKGLPILRPGHLVDEDLAGDADAILGYYQTHGWIGAKVDKPRVIEGSKPQRLVVTVPIEEGPRAVVASVKLVGAEHAGDQLGKKLLVKAGEPFNPNLVRQDVFNMQTYYGDHGWREASVHDEFTVSADKTTAEVVYRIDEGLRSFFGKTIVRGNTRTDTGRVARLLTWKEGQPFSDSDLIETQRSLTRTGVFRRVEVKPQPADPATRATNVDVELQEGRPLSLLYGFGYQYAPTAESNQNDPYALAGVSYNNLFGRMLNAAVEAQYAPISGRGRLQATLREPFLFNRNIPLTVTGFFTREPIQNLDIRRLGTVVESVRYYGKYLRAGMRYEYQRISFVNQSAVSGIDLKNFPRFDQPIEESTIGPNGFYDRRDDIIDPHGGYYLTAGFKYAFPFLSATARYGKLSGQGAYFREIGGGSVVAIAVRGGGIKPYGPSTIPVPIAERFFAGGRSTNRAFDTDLLGIPGVTVDYDTKATPHTGTGDGSCAGAYPALSKFDCSGGPRIVGGNGFLALNAELRFPIFGDLGGTLFYDASQVWANASQIRLALEEDQGLRQGVGVGLRYMTPIGPLRVEYGWPVDPGNIPFSVTTTTTDATNKTVTQCLDSKSGSVVPAPCPVAGTTREKGRFFFSIGYPF